MSLDLMTPGTTSQRRAQLEFKSKLPFSLHAGDGRVALTDDGGGADITYIYDRHDRAGTFTRGTASAYVTARNGKLVQAFTNFPALEHQDHRTAGIYDVAGFRIEPARTNLLLRSEEFDNASWTKTDTTITQNVAPASPRGDFTADQVAEGTAGTALVSQAVTVSSGAIVAFSIWLYRSNHDWVGLQMFNGSDSVTAWFNLATQAAGSTANAGGGAVLRGYVVETLGSWTRCAVVGSLSGITSYTCCIFSASADASGTRVNSAIRYQWGAMADASGFVTSYIQTVGSTVTRNKDDLRFAAPWPVQPLSLYLAFTETGQKFATAGGVLASLCLTSSDSTDPRLYILGSSSINGYRVGWDPGTETTATLAAYPAINQYTELLVTLTAAGVATIYQSLDGAATTSAAASAQSLPGTTTYFGASQANARLVIGDLGAASTAPAALCLHSAKLDWGVKTMAQMRAAA